MPGFTDRVALECRDQSAGCVIRNDDTHEGKIGVARNLSTQENRLAKDVHIDSTNRKLDHACCCLEKDLVEPEALSLSAAGRK